MRARLATAVLALVVASTAQITWVHLVSAQSTDAVDLVVSAGAARGLDVERLRAGLAQELGCEVRVVDTPRRRRPGVATLTVRARGARIELERVRDDGSRMVRRGDLPEHAEERVATVVILAANMLRDEASELLDMLRRREPEPSDEGAPAPGTTEPEPIAEAVAPSDTEAESLTTPTETETASDAVAEAAASSEPATTTVSSSELEPEVTVRSATSTSEASSSLPVAAPSRPSPAFFRLGLATQIGSVPAGGGYDLTLVGGLELAFMPIPELAIGLRDIGAGVIPDTNRTHVDAALFAELAWAFVPEIALYGQVAAHVQARIFGANDPSTGVAPVLTGGARFQLAREFSIGVETSARIVATDTFATYFHVLPQGAVIWTGGLTLLFHVS